MGGVIVIVAAKTDVGRVRTSNEDAFAVAATSRPGGVPAVVAVVCDGVSSATRPDEASQAAADTATNPGAIVTAQIPSYVTVDAMLAYPVNDKFSLILNGYNLANTYYYTDSYFSSPMENHIVPGVGRTFLLTANLSL